MNLQKLTRVDRYEWRIEPRGAMRVPGVIFADQDLIEAMDDKVFEQVANVASLPGIVKASYAMPDAHWGYGFPIGGVAAFDPDDGGVISAGGVGFDISCGVRTLHTGLTRADIDPVKEQLADALFAQIPAGVGSTGAIHLSADDIDCHAARRRAVGRSSAAGARREDLQRIEERGRMAGADPTQVSGQSEAAAARRDGYAGVGQSLPRGAGGRAESSTAARRTLSTWSRARW